MSEIGYVRNNYGVHEYNQNSTKAEAQQAQNKSIFLEDDGNGTFEMSDIKTDGIKDLGALKVMLQKYVGKPLAEIANEITSKIEEFMSMGKEDKVKTQMQDYVNKLAEYIVEHGSTEGFAYTGMAKDIEDFQIVTAENFDDSSNDIMSFKDGQAVVQRNPDGFEVTVKFKFDGKEYAVGTVTKGIPNKDNNKTETLGNQADQPDELQDSDIPEITETVVNENGATYSTYTVNGKDFASRQEAKEYLQQMQ